MPVARYDAEKKRHQVTVMQLSFDSEMGFSAICPQCTAYALLTDQQAGMGKALCFGEVILLTWTKE
jgi:hypothetical protein